MKGARYFSVDLEGYLEGNRRIRIQPGVTTTTVPRSRSASISAKQSSRSWAWPVVCVERVAVAARSYRDGVVTGLTQ